MRDAKSSWVGRFGSIAIVGEIKNRPTGINVTPVTDLDVAFTAVNREDNASERSTVGGLGSSDSDTLEIESSLD